MKLTKSYLDELTYAINGAAIEVHKTLGPGLLEKVYQHCLMHELSLRNINFEYEVHIPIKYKELITQGRIRCDLLVENAIVVELKAASQIIPIDEAQLLTYMKLLEKPKGILYNFNVVHLFSQGQKTYVNELFRQCA